MSVEKFSNSVNRFKEDYERYNNADNLPRLVIFSKYKFLLKKKSKYPRETFFLNENLLHICLTRDKLVFFWYQNCRCIIGNT